MIRYSRTSKGNKTLPVLFFEVLQNIIENAIKYGSGKKIGISISKEEDCVLITVENTGEVLPAEELPHLFDSFYRGSNAGSQEGNVI